MTVNVDWRNWKLWTGVALAFVLALDLALGFVLWQSFSQGPEAMRADRDRLSIREKLLHADVDRGEKIRMGLPQAGKDCEAFYRESFLDGATGYSQIESDLAAIASRSGVKTSGFSFKQKEIKERGVTEISIDTAVEADYPAVIQFVNGVERSKNFYLLDGLHLASATTGGIRLQLQLHTYFRT